MTHSGSLPEAMDRSPSGAGSRGMTGFSARGTQLSRVVIVALVDADAAAGHVGDDSGDGHAFHDVAAVEVVALFALQGLPQRGLVVAPVKEVPAADVLPAGEVQLAGTVGYFLEIAEVVSALPKDGAVDVVPAAFGRDEVVPGTEFVGDELFAELVGLHEVVVEVPHLRSTPGSTCAALWDGVGELALGCQTVMGRRGARSVLGWIGVLGADCGEGGMTRGMKTGFRVKTPD